LGIGSDLAGVVAASYPTIEEEVRGVLRQIKRSLQSGDFAVEDVALVARTESSYGEWVREIAWEYELPVVTHYSVTLLETRAGQWLSALLEVCERADFPFEATARLFQHALGGKLRGELWDATNWDEARKEHTRGAAQWDRLGLSIANISWPAEASRPDWCELIRATMRDLQLRELSIYRPQDLAAYEKLYEALDEFSLPRTELLTRSEIVSQLRDLLRITSVPSGTSSSGIEVHTPLSLYGASVKHVYVLGEAEGELPRPIADDAMLDFHDRKLLSDQNLVQLESAAQAARRETLSFYSLLLAAENSLSFSYPRLDGSSVVRPSPFIRRMAVPVVHKGSEIEVAASRSELLRYQMQAGGAEESDVYIDHAKLASKVVRRREENRTLDDYTGQIGVSLSADDRTFSPSQVTTFGQCSYKWFAQKLLKLGDPEEAEDDLATNLKGLLYHEVLNQLLSKFKREENVRAAMLAELETTFDAVASGMSELIRLSGWHGRRFELLAQLTTAINGEDFLGENSKVLATEEGFKGEWLGLQVAGRLDRMDETPDGLLVIDYKTSGSVPKGAKDENGKLKLDVQLPIYMSIANDRAGGAAVMGYYYSLTKGEKLGKKGAEPDHEGLEALVASIRAQMNAGSYPLAPDVDGAACQYCELDILCRKGPYLFRNQEVEE
jgi:ATP-dependent helicase/DNAse subunit B